MHTCERKIIRRRGLQQPGKPDFRLNVAINAGFLWKGHWHSVLVMCVCDYDESMSEQMVWGGFELLQDVFTRRIERYSQELRA
eukprot:2714586-Amphidinium_carterae.1